MGMRHLSHVFCPSFIFKIRETIVAWSKYDCIIISKALRMTVENLPRRIGQRGSKECNAETWPSYLKFQWRVGCEVACLLLIQKVKNLKENGVYHSYRKGSRHH